MKRLRWIPSVGEFYRCLRCSGELRRLHGVREWDRPYYLSQLSKFRHRVGPRRLERIVDWIVRNLLKVGMIRGDVVALDASFIRT